MKSKAKDMEIRNEMLWRGIVNSLGELKRQVKLTVRTAGGDTAALSYAGGMQSAINKIENDLGLVD